MQFIKVKFLKDNQPTGRSYTYKCEEDIKAGDIVTNDKGSKLVVIDEPVDSAWVMTYGADKIGVVKKYISEEPKNEEVKTYDPSLANIAQAQYCKENDYPHFAPTCTCYSCHQNIYLKGKRRDDTEVNGISVEDAGKHLITGCPYCNWSYCD